MYVYYICMYVHTYVDVGDKSLRSRDTGQSAEASRSSVNGLVVDHFVHENAYRCTYLRTEYIFTSSDDTIL